MGIYEPEIVCERKLFRVNFLEDEPHMIYKDKRGIASSIINITKETKCIPKGCHSYFAYVVDTSNKKNVLEDI